MNFRKKFIKIITYQENIDREGFILKETKDDREKVQKEDNKAQEENPTTGRRSLKKPRRSPGTSKEGAAGDPEEVSGSLKDNKEVIQALYGLPQNKDIIVRDFVTNTVPEIHGFAVFVDGLVDKAVQDVLFQALIRFSHRPAPSGADKLVRLVKESLLPGNQVTVKALFKDILDGVNHGDTAIFLEGCYQAVLVETKGWEHRGIERPVNEQAIRGPQEAFSETLRANTALVRKLILNENLTTEFFRVGERSKSFTAIMYLRNLANPDLVAEVKRRLESIKVDYLVDSGVLEQFIEDNPYNLNPTILATERPDRVAQKITEGRVAIFCDGTPYVLVVPSTMYEQLHSGEEMYLRWQFGTFVRYLRVLAFLAAFLLPGLYLSVVLYHHEMLPTELLLTIAGNREKVPFPSVVEVLLMEFSFELIREAGLRIPGVMGSTIGIVGALILGQAAVQANIVSPILVILVAVTGLASFAIPYYSLAFSLRLYRFLYIALGATMGVFGIAFGLFVQTILTANLKSFGVPYLAPGGPRTASGADTVTRLPVFFHEKRPDYVNPLDITREPEVSRGWIKDRGGKGD